MFFLLPHRYLEKAELSNGRTGHVKFDDVGDRLYPRYEVMNMLSNRTATVVANYTEDEVCHIIMLSLCNGLSSFRQRNIGYL